MTSCLVLGTGGRTLLCTVPNKSLLCDQYRVALFEIPCSQPMGIQGRVHIFCYMANHAFQHHKSSIPSLTTPQPPRLTKPVPRFCCLSLVSFSHHQSHAICLTVLTLLPARCRSAPASKDFVQRSHHLSRDIAHDATNADSLPLSLVRHAKLFSK